MPGILPMKVIKVGTSAQARIAQACDRCRSKKIRCDGFRPCCSQCANVGFECKTSDKLSRRAFPRGYTESLEERVRVLETEVRELKDLLDAKDDKIDMLSKIRSSRHNSSSTCRPPSTHSTTAQPATNPAVSCKDPTTFTIHQSSHLYPTGAGHDPYFAGASNSQALVERLIHRAQESGISMPEVHLKRLFPVPESGAPGLGRTVLSGSVKVPPRLLTDQMVNVFFQEWAPLFPVLHRPTFLALYESYVGNPESVTCTVSLVQLNLVFAIAALSNSTRLPYDTSLAERDWLYLFDNHASEDTVATLQCLIMAQLYCFQIADYARLLRYKSQAVAMATRLGLNQLQERFGFGTLMLETRKKIFWTLYVLDCFSAAITGLPMLLNDEDVHVEYPIDVDDEYILDQGLQPVLPGEFTKLSSALALTRGSRLLARVLKTLYPSASTYELTMTDIATLNEELDSWQANLPPHLRMFFAQDKPSTHVISSRSPLISLTYHFIRTLIHRLPACDSSVDQASASLISLASSSKSIIQILQLLEERNLSFTYCLNKAELLVTCGASTLLQSLNLPQDSKLSKDSQRSICIAINMLQRQGFYGTTDFERLVRSLRDTDFHTNGGETIPTGGTSTAVSSNERPTGIEHAHAAAHEKSSAKTGNKCYRAIAPSTHRQESSDISIKSSPSSSGPCVDTSQQKTSSPESSRPNLDYFSFSTPSCQDGSCKGSNEDQKCLDASDWNKLLSSLSEDQSSYGVDENDWPSINELLTPLHDEGSVESSKSMAESLSPGTSTLSPTNSRATKSQSLLSFSDESFTSGEDFSSIDWGCSDQDGAFRAISMPVFDHENNHTLCPDGEQPVIIDP